MTISKGDLCVLIARGGGTRGGKRGTNDLLVFTLDWGLVWVAEDQFETVKVT